MLYKSSKSTLKSNENPTLAHERSIRILHVVAGMNRGGIETWLMDFLRQTDRDSDDAWHPEKIAVQYSWMIQNPDIALSGHQVVLQKGKTQLNYEPVPSNIKYQKIDRNKILFSNTFCTSSVMIKRDIKQRFSPSLRYSQDYFLWLEIILEGSQASVLSFPVAYYFKYPFGEGGQTKNLLNGKAAEEEIYRRLWKFGAITFVEWRILCLWSLARYYRRMLICLLR